MAKRILSLFLCLALLVGMLPTFTLQASAEETTDSENVSGLAQPIAETNDAAAAYIESIAVTTPPAKTVYAVGEELDTTGMVVTATYSDGTTAELTGWNTSSVDMTTVGEKEATVSYTVDDSTLTAVFAVTVEDTASPEANEPSANAVNKAAAGTEMEPTTAVVKGATITTSTTKTVYVLVNSISAAGDYLIVNTGSAAANANMLTASSNGVTNTNGVTVTAGTDAAGNSVTYIENPVAAAVWTATVDGSGYRLFNSDTSRYLRYNNNSLGTNSNNVTTWYSGTNTVYYSSKNSSRFICYNNNGWGIATNSQTVYIYKKQDVEFTTTTTADGTYSIEGKPAEVTRVVVGGVTAELGSTLTFTADVGTVHTTDTSTTAKYTVVEGTDTDGVISGISDNTVTFTGAYGEAWVKVSYTAGDESFTVDNYIKVIAKKPTYSVTILDKDGETAGNTITIRGNTVGAQYDLGSKVTFEDSNGVTDAENQTVAWEIISGGNVASIDAVTGVVTFRQASGEVKVKVTYTVDENTVVEDEVTLRVHEDTYIRPSDSTTDFPTWPNEGAVRYNKTAKAVGNFSNTGIAQVELSMAGIPVKSGGAVDVVLVVDFSKSMDNNNRMAYAKEASRAFVKGLASNEENRLAIVSFSDNNKPAVVQFAFQELTAENVTEANKAIDQYRTDGYTNYVAGLSSAQDILDANKVEGRQQFVVFLSDGAPSQYRPLSSQSDDNSEDLTADAGNSSEEWISSGARDSNDWEYEYYTTHMKRAGITVYTVGLGLNSRNYQPQYLLNDMSGPAYETANDTGSDKTKLKKYYYEVADSNSADALSSVFANIAEVITAAASNVEVKDQIENEYELILAKPEAVDASMLPENGDQEFYIEVVNYALDDTTHDRTGAYEVLQRIYLNGNEVSEIMTGSVTADGVESLTETNLAPAYAVVSEDEKGYFDANGNYKPDGTGTHKMTAGAAVSVDADSSLTLHTAYFTYVEATKTFTWNVTELSGTEEIALRYFAYLTGSAESVQKGLTEGEEGYVAPGTYPTNTYANLTYKNHLDNWCQQTFPVPQLTWNGAQVSYVFYLVNENGVPVNQAGREVTFAEAVFVTEPHTEAVVWNKDGTEGASELNVEWLASTLLPEDYEVYDSSAKYELHVYQSDERPDWFKISGSEDAVSQDTTKVYNTMQGTRYSAYGEYKSTDTGMSDFDFANTTVAFAVTWEQKLVEDAVVVDYGLPVDIDVTSNDFVYNYITAIGEEIPKTGDKEVVKNTGTYDASALRVKVDESSKTSDELELGVHTAKVINENTVRFTPGGGTSMEFSQPVDFNYETKTDYYVNGEVQTKYMYSSVTVIPATTVYYEDSFVTLNSFTNNTQDNPSRWSSEGTAVNATQDQDRPGESKITAALDADNNYGYDSAYKTMSTFSMGSAAKITVNAATRGEAEFTFYGTGFDVVGLTSDDTGTIIVQVYNGNQATGAALKSTVVDTYYGMNADGSVNVNTPDAVYQVPVMKISGLEYGLYTAKIIAGYNTYFDHTTDENGAKDGKYDLYLDAIRIYDPAGNENETANNAYADDGEGWPVYAELRNNIIEASNYNVTENEDGTVIVTGDKLSGAIFIDCSDETTAISDYVNYGPNNELYLAKDQAISFNVAVDETVADVQLGVKLANGTAAVYEINGDECTVQTAADMYYSIKDYAVTTTEDGAVEGKTVTIKNTGDGILSLTNIKVTYTQAPTATADLLWMDESSVDYALMSLRTAAEEPETSEPETEEPEVSEPEETVPEEEEKETLETKVNKMVNAVKNMLSNLFSKWFR